jgi:hypothetical protein
MLSTGKNGGQATEFPAEDVWLVFTRLGWREIGSQSPILRFVAVSGHTLAGL